MTNMIFYERREDITERPRRSREPIVEVLTGADKGENEGRREEKREGDFYMTRFDLSGGI